MNGLIFIRTPATNPTQHNLRGQDDTQQPLIIINWTY
jgi:hypothetical protein